MNKNTTVDFHFSETSRENELDSLHNSARKALLSYYNCRISRMTSQLFYCSFPKSREFSGCRGLNVVRALHFGKFKEIYIFL